MALHTLVDSLKSIQVEKVMGTGDFTEHGRMEEWAWIRKELLELIDYSNIGNHDAGWNGIWFQNSAYEMALRALRKSTPYYFEDFGDYRFITLDTMQDLGRARWSIARGRIGKKQMKWLEKALDTPNKCIVMLHHHPFFRTPSLELIDSKDFLTLSDKMHAVFYGHKHEADVSGKFFASDATLMSRRYRVVDLKDLTWFWIHF